MLSGLSIKNRLILGFFFFNIMLIFIGVISIYSSQYNITQIKEHTLKDAISSNEIARIKYRMELNRRELMSAIQHDPSFSMSALHDHPVTKHINSIADNNKVLLEKLHLYSTSITDPQEQKLLDQWLIDSDNLGINSIQESINSIKDNKWQVAEELAVKKVNPIYIKSELASKTLVNYLTKRDEATNISVNNMIEDTTYVLITIIILSSIIGIILGWLLINRIMKPLQQAVDIAKLVSEGDLTSNITIENEDEIGILLHTLKTMNTNLSHIISEVRTGTETISTASRQISAGNLDLSNRTESQASSLEETASAIEELTSTVKQNADNAHQANQLATSASSIAIQGGNIVANVVETMGQINDSSRKIADIIGVIDSIAFQTNILALNAAVEAARAGEQGRGFAVVASEVRSLAQRSAVAAKEIKALINDSVEKIEIGNKQVNQAGVTMKEVVSSVQQVNDIMNAISVASKEQSTGIEEVNQAISQMDEVTQQNAALVEEAAAASKSMQDQSIHLDSLVNQFKIIGQKSTPKPNQSKTTTQRPIPTTKNKIKSPSKSPSNYNEDWEEF
jgi:methyl-accepting chemotaxis protein